jgi:hypothetical protein
VPREPAPAVAGSRRGAGPDGTEAFPSVRTLIRYTDLSERTALDRLTEAFPGVRTLIRYTDLSERTALDRLEAEGIIWPPGVFYAADHGRDAACRLP